MPLWWAIGGMFLAFLFGFILSALFRIHGLDEREYPSIHAED